VIAFKIVLLVVLAATSLVLASVEAAFYLVKRRRLSLLAHHSKWAELASHYLDDPPTLLMPVQMGTYTAHVAMTVVITSLFLDLLAHWAMLIAFLVMVGYLLVFRLTAPYALVRRRPERSLLLLLPAFHAYAQVLRPLVMALRARVMRDPGGEPDDTGRAATLPEVPPAPVHDENEGRLVESVARFSSMLVRDVMTPRPDLVAVAAGATVGELRKLLRETKYSRLPVYGENLDDIQGVISVRDLMEHEGTPEEAIRPLVREAFLVPETKKLAELLKELQSRRLTFAIVIDEYGGTAGLVTMEDIVEEIVGEIKDEYDVETEPISVEAEGAVLVAGRVNVDRLEQALEADLAEGDEVGTVGGLVTSVFGRIPRVGERIEFRGFEIEVVDAEHKRVNRVRFRKLPDQAPE
jgi:CBS domain containing-hemolysin-like protein